MEFVDIVYVSVRSFDTVEAKFVPIFAKYFFQDWSSFFIIHIICW